MKSNRGFTLIELLVVIAIIGILSSVVLASLNTARSRGADANIKANLSTVAVQAELYYDTENGYGDSSGDDCDAANTMFVDPTVDNALTEIEERNGGANDVVCFAADTAYAVSSPLIGAASSTSFCVDSTGFRGEDREADATGACI